MDDIFEQNKVLLSIAALLAALIYAIVAWRLFPMFTSNRDRYRKSEAELLWKRISSSWGILIIVAVLVYTWLNAPTPKHAQESLSPPTVPTAPASAGLVEKEAVPAVKDDRGGLQSGGADENVSTRAPATDTPGLVEQVPSKSTPPGDDPNASGVTSKSESAGGGGDSSEKRKGFFKDPYAP